MTTLSTKVIGLSHLFINSQFELFDRYTKDMEASIVDIESELIDKYETMTQGYSEEELDQFWEFHMDDHNDVNKEYPNLLRSNSLINAYTFFEKSLLENHTYLKRAVTTLFPQAKDLKSSSIKRMDGSVIERLKACFDNISFPFPNGDEWKTILKYNLIRNNLIHKGGIVENHTDSTNELVIIINDLPNVSISPNSGRILFEEQFSFDVFKTMADFFELFFAEIHKYKTANGL